LYKDNGHGHPRPGIEQKVSFTKESEPQGYAEQSEVHEMSRSLLNIEKRSLPRLMLSGVGLASKDAV
jgi:hypothetical protein